MSDGNSLIQVNSFNFKAQVNENNISASLKSSVQKLAILGIAGKNGNSSNSTFTSQNVESDLTITSADNFKRFYTTGATGTINLTLSDIEADDEFIIVLRENFRVNVILDSGQTLTLGAGNIATSSVYNSKKGSVLHIWAIDSDTLQALYQTNWVNPS